MQYVQLSADQIADRMHLLGRVLRPLAHQFSNDVTFLTSTLELALAQDLPDGLAPNLQQASAFSQEMCDELRRAARSVTVSPDQAAPLVSLADLLDELSSELELPKGVELVGTCAPDCHAAVDPTAWVAGIAALVHNGVEAGATSIRVTVDSDQRVLAVTVADNGSGFKPGALQDALLPFVTSKPLPHRGLGLAAVQAMAAAHQASLSITTGEMGTTVVLKMPRAAGIPAGEQFAGIKR